MAIRTTPTRTAVVALMLSACATDLMAQTAIKLPKNKFTPQQDVELGREAATEVRQQYPVINDVKITAYLTKLGDRLVTAAPADLKQSVYEYSFTPINPLAPVDISFISWGGMDFTIHGGSAFGTQPILDDVIVNAVPEPGAATLLICGGLTLAGIGARRWRSRAR